MKARNASSMAMATLALAVSLLAGCGGGSSGNQLPVPVISSPAQGSTFRAGDTLTFTGSATDSEDGVLPASGLTWWADLHHDAHTHPFRQQATGGSGTVTIPVRGETSDNVWYRFHLRATDSSGQQVTVTRDVMPQRSQVTLATQPVGLQLALDGQPVTAPTTFTGVVGMERDLTALGQNFGGRQYQFSGWSDGGGATHTVSTPAANTTYTATFVDAGPATNQPPTVSVSAAANGTVGAAMDLTASAADSDGSVARVEFFDGGALLNADTSSPYAFTWTPVSIGTHNLTARAIDDDGATTISTAVAVDISAAGGGDTTAPAATLTAPANFASGLTGTLNLAATASDNVGVAGVEFQVDGAIVGSEDTAAPYQASVDTGAYAAGQHVLRARARDAAGNLSAWATATVQFGGNNDVPQGFTMNQAWVAGLTGATAFARAPDGRFFIAEQGGALRVVRDGVLLLTPFRQFAVDVTGERGLLGVALHPNFATNGFVYVYYTTTSGGIHNRISRLVANGDVAAGAETVLADLPTLASVAHNGGAMHFGADGKLYVGVGENAEPLRAQDLSDPFGKMLRFNDDGSIPSDNPFCTTPGQLRCAIWAYGLRNPFTFAVQPGTGRIHINDVGAGTWEEVNLGAAGANYGWPGSEGPDNVTAGVTAPLFAYRHSDTSPPGSGPGGFFTGLAITGGVFYPATGNFPVAYRGSYFFAEHGLRWIARLDVANGNAAYAFARITGTLGDHNPLDLLVGADGALYVLTRTEIVRISAP